MDLGRVAIAAALAALPAGCRGAAAAPDVQAAGGFTPPAGWVALPRVAAAAKAAMAPHEARAAAWGDPAAGCYVVIASTRGDGDDAGDARAALVAGLGLGPADRGGSADRVDGEL